jgi:hypothetical protein
VRASGGGHPVVGGHGGRKLGGRMVAPPEEGDVHGALQSPNTQHASGVVQSCGWITVAW